MGRVTAFTPAGNTLTCSTVCGLKTLPAWPSPALWVLTMLFAETKARFAATARPDHATERGDTTKLFVQVPTLLADRCGTTELISTGLAEISLLNALIFRCFL